MASAKAWWLELRLLIISYCVTEVGLYVVKSLHEGLKVYPFEVLREINETLSIIQESQVLEGLGVGRSEYLQAF